MGRRSNHTREELQAMVIKATQEIVIKEGVRALTTRKIATHIGYTVGTLYHFFENVDDIIVHVNAATLDKLYDYLTKYCLKKKSYTVTTIAYGYLEFSKKHFSQWQLLFEYLIPATLEYPDWYKEKIARLFELTRHSLVEHDSIPLTKLENTTRVLWSGIHGICVLHNSRKLPRTNSATPEILVDNFITHYLAGFKR